MYVPSNFEDLLANLKSKALGDVKENLLGVVVFLTLILIYIPILVIATFTPF